jgi:hypothetical protein
MEGDTLTGCSAGGVGAAVVGRRSGDVVSELSSVDFLRSESVSSLSGGEKKEGLEVLSSPNIASHLVDMATVSFSAWKVLQKRVSEIM